MENWLKGLESEPGGLVLGGGGARGCYQIGLWKALQQHHIQFERVSGTSIGALVGAMYVQGSLEAMIHFVETIRPTKIAADLFHFPETLGAWVENRKEISSYLQKYIFSRQGMDISPLKDTIHDMFDYSVFAASPVNFACMTFNLTRKEPEAYFKSEMTEADAQDIILASASCYPAFPVLKMNGCEYIDGGYWDNVPIDLAAKMGAKKILAVNVEGPGVIAPVLDDTLDVFEIRPILPLGNFLDFSSASCMKNLDAGYLETSRLLGSLCGFVFSFAPSSKAALAFVDGYLAFMFQIHRIVISPENLEATARWAIGFHPSDLSALLMKGRGEGLLLECLGYLAGLDPWRVWTFEAFMEALMKKLCEMDTQSHRLWKHLRHIGHREVDRQGAVTLMVTILKNRPVQDARNELQALSALYPAETAMAWTWYFLEEAYGCTR